MEGLKDLLDAGNVRKIEMTFDADDRGSFERVDSRDLPDGFKLSKVHIASGGSVYVGIKRES